MIYNEKQREITVIQIRRLNSELRLLKKFKPIDWAKDTQIGALASVIEDLELELTQFNNRRHSDKPLDV